jgi:cell division control protein 6
VIYALQVELTENEIISIRKEIRERNSIFLEKKYLDSLFSPSNIIGRKNQARQILEYFESLKHDLIVPAISVFGRSGSGKSTVVKFVCSNMQDLISFAFVNIRKARTVFGCANMVLSELGSEPCTSADGLTKAIDMIGKKIKEILSSQNRRFFVLVLDEYDVIFYDKRGNPSDFMYKLLTLEENLREENLWLCIVTISNNALADYNLDDRVKSRMGNSEVFFDPYSEGDVCQFLKTGQKRLLFYLQRTRFFHFAQN